MFEIQIVLQQNTVNSQRKSVRRKSDRERNAWRLRNLTPIVVVDVSLDDRQICSLLVFHALDCHSQRQPHRRAHFCWREVNVLQVRLEHCSTLTFATLLISVLIAVAAWAVVTLLVVVAVIVVLVTRRTTTWRHFDQSSLSPDPAAYAKQSRERRVKHNYVT